ncbi:MAG: NAD(P)H-dependent glycerol-3-phosphate dehydrogenase [Pseudomonadota bacterium]
MAMPLHPRIPFPWAVIGAGAWGTALADTLAHAGNPVVVWDRDPLVTDDITRNHANRKRYPEGLVHPSLTATTQFEEAVKGTHAIMLAVPSEAHEYIATQLKAHLAPHQALVLGAKGFRERDGRLLSHLWQEAFPENPVMVLSGPTFAAELMAHSMTACVLAGRDEELRAGLAHSMMTPWFKVYETQDLIGVQVGGALKNVLAIAAGMLDGLEMGLNARAALLTRGIAEMGRLAKALGGEDQTLYGLAGVGDLLLTATSTLSRNYRFGVMVGKGVAVPEAKLRLGTVEGVLAARIATVQGQSLGVDLSIIAALDGILHGDVAPLQALEYLMLQPRELER